MTIQIKQHHNTKYKTLTATVLTARDTRRHPGPRHVALLAPSWQPDATDKKADANDDPIKTFKPMKPTNIDKTDETDKTDKTDKTNKNR